jgi:hypothetical protein
MRIKNLKKEKELGVKVEVYAQVVFIILIFYYLYYTVLSMGVNKGLKCLGIEPERFQRKND